MMSMNWFVAYTHLKAEQKASEGMQARGLATFMPMSSGWVRRAHRRIMVQRLLFPRYMFVGIDPLHNVGELYGVDGVGAILGNERGPVAVSANIVSGLQAAQTAGQFDEARISPIKPGTQVKFMHGPFVGLLGQCHGLRPEQRADVLISLLGREVNVKTHLDHLIAVA